MFLYLTNYSYFLFPLAPISCEMKCLLTNQELFNLSAQWRGQGGWERTVKEFKEVVHSWGCTTPVLKSELQMLQGLELSRGQIWQHVQNSILWNVSPHALLEIPITSSPDAVRKTLWQTQLKGERTCSRSQLPVTVYYGREAAVTLHPQPDGEDKEWMHAGAQLLPGFFIRVLTPSPGNSATQSGQLFTHQLT